jgi:hypothetical protein
MPKPTSVYDPEPVQSTTHPHSLFPYDLSYKLTKYQVAELEVLKTIEAKPPLNTMLLAINR